MDSRQERKEILLLIRIDNYSLPELAVNSIVKLFPLTDLKPKYGKQKLRVMKRFVIRQAKKKLFDHIVHFITLVAYIR